MQLHTMPLKVERFLSSRKVRGMALDELGAYLLILMESWLDGGSIPASEVRDTIQCSDEDWARIKDRVVDRMFSVVDGRLVNGTLSDIYRETAERSEKFRESGR